MSAVLKSELETEVERYHTWRDELLEAVDGYRDWLEKTANSTRNTRCDSMSFANRYAKVAFRWRLWRNFRAAKAN